MLSTSGATWQIVHAMPPMISSSRLSSSPLEVGTPVCARQAGCNRGGAVPQVHGVHGGGVHQAPPGGQGDLGAHRPGPISCHRVPSHRVPSSRAEGPIYNCRAILPNPAFEVGPQPRVVPFELFAVTAIPLPRSRRQVGANSTSALGSTKAR